MLPRRRPLFECIECGLKFFTEGAAQRAIASSSGCPKCNGSCITVYNPDRMEARIVSTEVVN